MKNKKILILVNHDLVIYNFRKELVEALISEGYEVYVSSPNGKRIPELVDMGCKFIETNVNRHGKNILEDIKLLINYDKMIKRINPGYVLSYTIKPNIYGSIASRKNKVNYVPNITGLGVAIEKNNILSKILLRLYSFSFKDAKMIFFQNSHNLELFKKHRIIKNNYKLLPGSGVNLTQFKFKSIKERKKFAYFGRLMTNKGTSELLDAIELIKNEDRYNNISFIIIGSAEEKHLLDRVKKLNNQGKLSYLERQNDIEKYYDNVTCIINPSYHEGMSNVLLEGAASGRVLIASDIPGCREIIENGKNGYTFEPRSPEKLKSAILKIASLTLEELNEMGQYSRKKVEKEFSREIVIQEYLKVLGGN